MPIYFVQPQLAHLLIQIQIQVFFRALFPGILVINKKEKLEYITLVLKSIMCPVTKVAKAFELVTARYN